MSKLNKKLEMYRDTHLKCSNYNNIREVLNQLLIIGFNNEKNPNELPNEFIIKCVHFSKHDFEALMLDIGFTVKAKEKFVDFYNRQYTYEVSLK